MALYVKLAVSVNGHSNLEPSKYAESICSTSRCPSSRRKINSNLRYPSSLPASHVWVSTTPLCFGEMASGTRDIEKANEIQHQKPQPGLARTAFVKPLEQFCTRPNRPLKNVQEIADCRVWSKEGRTRMVMLDGSNHTSRSSLSLKAFQIDPPTYTNLTPESYSQPRK